MKHTLVCCIFLTALQDGNTGSVKAQTRLHRAEEGGNITVACSFKWSGSRKLFCKETCDSGRILVKTSDDAAQNGRYSIKYEKKGMMSYPTLYVSITQLNQSDSGRYRCSLDRDWWKDGNYDFELTVTEASTTSTPNRTLRPFSASTPPTTQSLSSTSRSSTPSSASSGSSGVLIHVGLILVVMFVVLAAALLLFYMKRRTTKPRGPPVETDTQANWLYEEIRECDIPSGSLPVEVSSVYDYPKGPRSDADESGGIYSLVTSPQSKVEDNSRDLGYTEVDFSHSPDTNSALCGNAADAVCSTSSADLSTTKDASPPIYSTVTSV